MCPLTCDLAAQNDFDVVLIDTAGRMQDNEVKRYCVYMPRWLMICSQPLMRALAKVSGHPMRRMTWHDILSVGSRQQS